MAAWLGRIVRTRGFVMVVLVLVAGAAGLHAGSVLRDPPPRPPGVLWPDGRPIGPFSLDDHRGGAFDRERLMGRWTLLSFGYTSCPDVCPATLAALAAARAHLRAGPNGDADVSVVFVSVDPARDSTERLAAWAPYFGEEILAATGSDTALQALTTQLGVMYEARAPDANGHYLVDHSASVMLIDPDARLVAVFSTPHVPESIARRVDAIRDDAGS